VLPETLPNFPELKKLIISENGIADFKNLTRVAHWKKCRHIILDGNPFEEGEGIVKELLILM